MTLINKTFLLLSILIFVTSCNKKTKFDYCFSNKNKGWNVLITNCKKGHQLKKEKNRYKIVFPDNGIFIGAFEQPDGVNHEFYTYNKNGDFHLLKNDRVCNIIASKKVGFNVNYYSDYFGLDDLEHEMLEYDFIFFNISDNCENSIHFEEYYLSVKKFLIKNKIFSKYND